MWFARFAGWKISLRSAVPRIHTPTRTFGTIVCFPIMLIFFKNTYRGGVFALMVNKYCDMTATNTSCRNGHSVPWSSNNLLAISFEVGQHRAGVVVQMGSYCFIPLRPSAGRACGCCPAWDIGSKRAVRMSWLLFTPFKHFPRW